MVFFDGDRNNSQETLLPGELADRIRNRGHYCLYGKFYDNWFAEEIKPVGYENHFRAVPKNDPDLLNAFTAQRILEAFQDVDLFDGMPSNSINYLVITPVRQGYHQKLDVDENGVVVVYRMFSHKDYTPDSRWNHPALDFSFCLKGEEAGIFRELVKKDPLFIERIFQNMFKELTAGGRLQRIKTQTLCFVDLQKNNIDEVEACRQSLGARGLRKMKYYQQLQYPQQVGEIPLS